MYFLRIFVVYCASCLPFDAAAQTTLVIGEWQHVAPYEWRSDIVERGQTMSLVAQIFATIVGDSVIMRYVTECAPHETEKNAVHIWEAGVNTGTGKDCDGDKSIMVLNEAVQRSIIERLPEPAARIYKQMRAKKMRARNDYV